MRPALLALLLMMTACNRAAAPSPPDLAPIAVAPPPSVPAFVASDIPRIDVHTHVVVGALAKALTLAKRHGIVHLVNLSGESPGDGFEEVMAEAKQLGHTTVFVNPDFHEAK